MIDTIFFCCSHAISAYLVNQYGKDDSLYPKDAKKRAIVDRMLYFDTGALYNRFGDYVVSVMSHDVGKWNFLNILVSEIYV